MISKIFKYQIIILGFLMLLSCNKERKNTNPYLKNISFSRDLNLDLPQYSGLKFANNSALIDGIGIKGVIVFNTGSSYTAWEASDPNHLPSNCSTMLPDQFTCQCPCEDNKYSLYDGQKISGEGDYPLKAYRVSQSGNILHISN